MKNNTTIHRNFLFPVRAPGKRLTKAAGLLLLLGCCVLQGQAVACAASADVKSTHSGQPHKASASHAQKNSSSIDLDYFQSSDNPFHAD